MSDDNALINIGGKSIEKLIDVVSKGIGVIYKPRAIRKEAEAKAYETEILAKAEAKKIQIEGDAKIELYSRAKERLAYQEITRQTNIEEIAEKSIKYLEKEVSENPVDEDWRNRFFNKAQDISSEEMQEIWAQILANEVSQPGKISLRTLEVVANVSKTEAEKFEIACSLSSNRSLIWKLAGGNNSLDEFNLTYSDLMILRDAWLIHDWDNLLQIFKIIPQFGLSICNIGDDFYQIKNIKNPEITEFRFGQIAFTTAGKELCRLINTPLNQEYIKKIVEQRMSEGYEVTRLVSKE